MSGRPKKDFGGINDIPEENELEEEDFEEEEDDPSFELTDLDDDEDEFNEVD